MTDPEHPPTSARAWSAEARVTEMPLPEGFDPVALLARLRAEGRRGAALLESAEEGGRRPLRTLLVTRPWLRVVLGAGEEAAPVTLEALCDGGEELARRLGPEVAEIAARHAGPAQRARGADGERMRAGDVLDVLRRVAGAVRDRTRGAVLPPGLFGAFSYEIVDRFEPLPSRRPDPLHEPDASFVLAGDLVVVDHRARRLQVISRGLPWEERQELDARHRRDVECLPQAQDGPGHGGAGSLAAAAAIPSTADDDELPGAADVHDDAFRAGVEDLRRHIHAGDVYQAVLSRGWTVDADPDPLAIYAALRAENPSPYQFLLDLGDGELLGSSPETFLRVEDGAVEIRPIAGTAPRGRATDGTLDDDLDARLALAMQLDPKEQAEHAMLLDLARNDVARVSVPGSTRVVQQLAIEKYSHVQHLVSRVRGRLAPDLDALHAFRAAANMGTLTGAPKPRAMELIREAEPRARGFYGGAAGYLLADGRFDSCIVIRSLRRKDGACHLRAGAGVVWDSDPQRELEETAHKARACRRAVAHALALEEARR